MRSSYFIFRKDRQGKLEGLRETLDHIPWEFAISSSDLNDSVTEFQDLLLSAIAEQGSFNNTQRSFETTVDNL